jgi:hypothetical protein
VNLTAIRADVFSAHFYHWPYRTGPCAFQHGSRLWTDESTFPRRVACRPRLGGHRTNGNLTVTISIRPAPSPVIDNSTTAGSIPRVPEKAASPSPWLNIGPTATFKQAAHRWLDAGFAVIPVIPAQKRTAVKWDDWLSGLDHERIDRHWDAHPEHEVGFIVPDDVIVLDADAPAAVVALQELEMAAAVEPRLIVNTNRGVHHYLKVVPGTVVRTNVHATDSPSTSDRRKGPTFDGHSSAQHWKVHCPLLHSNDSRSQRRRSGVRGYDLSA